MVRGPPVRNHWFMRFDGLELFKIPRILNVSLYVQQKVYANVSTVYIPYTCINFLNFLKR